VKKVVVENDSDILGTTYVICDHPGCTNQFKLTYLDIASPGSEGWFQKKDGDAWCPDHIPEWVAKWRAKHNKS
jgi:hypothetical protein